MKISVIAFDADDTLWENENHFQEIEGDFCSLLSSFGSKEDISAKLLEVEMKNLPYYGFGAKGFTLSMLETAERIMGHQLEVSLVQKILGFGKYLLDMPINLLSGVEETFDHLHGKFPLCLITKEDLLDQERKEKKSGLGRYFSEVRILCDKREIDYEGFLRQISCRPEGFLMVGNSMKSDILPVIPMGGHAAYVPFTYTWAHEVHQEKVEHERIYACKEISEILHVIREVY